MNVKPEEYFIKMSSLGPPKMTDGSNPIDLGGLFPFYIHTSNRSMPIERLGGKRA